ncbi:MAG: glycoside hydrolase family 43 protein [Xanthomonadales bacterium]
MKRYERWVRATVLLLAATTVVAAVAAPVAGQKAKSAFYRAPLKTQMDDAAPVFRNVTVHDPSVIRVDDTYYVFGSHLAAAKTTDFMQWDLVADGVSPANPLFENVVTELADIFEWSGGVGLWANNVTQLDDGRFYMYPNLSQSDAPRASIGLAVADDVEGPYDYRGIFLQSGMWDEISEDGVNVYDPTIHPNTIDPHVFFDLEHRLWMVYGSYSGGIFILEMDPESGLPFEGQGYGTHLVGGNHARIEGPFILYSPHTGYYYLFVSFGGLAAGDGYNIRVARSANPNGPYFDAMGVDMATVKGAPGTLFDDASIAPYGQKLFGDHFWERYAGEPGTTTGHGYVSPGHNSAYYEPETGRYYLVFHTRFPGQGEFHQVRVHEMFMNAEGWPVVAPYRWVPYRHVPYADIPFVRSGFPFYRKNCPQKRSCWNMETVAVDETPGDYKLINHGKAIRMALAMPEDISLNADGSISGDHTGYWSRSFANRITIDLDEAGRFEGVMSRGWNETSQQFVLTFSAQSVEGISIWGSQLAQ